jgi:membrane protein insertase Oxa1/YidC/SpoIIIJ
VLEKKENKNEYSMMPNPEIMNKFMLYWMPIMVWVFTYSLFAWIWVYWAISTLFALAQNLVVNRYFKK